MSSKIKIDVFFSRMFQITTKNVFLLFSMRMLNLCIVGIVISAFALPIVLTRAPVTAIQPNSTISQVDGIVSIQTLYDLRNCKQSESKNDVVFLHFKSRIIWVSVFNLDLKIA